MTAVTSMPRGALFTAADLAAMGGDGNQYQLIDGALIVVPGPARDHQRMQRELGLVLCRACPDDLEVLFAPFDVVLGADTSIQPDLLVTRLTDGQSTHLDVAPLLAVEVMSPSTRSVDLILKKDRLERAGCMSYWVLDPRDVRLRAWELDGGRYVEVADVSGEQTWRSELPYAVDLCPARLLGR